MASQVSFSKIQGLTKSQVIQSVLDGEIDSLLAYGTLRHGGSNFEFYSQGLIPTGNFLLITDAALYTHGPFPYLLKDTEAGLPVHAEELIMIDSSVIIKIIEMECRERYECGQINNALVFFWPETARQLSQMLGSKLNKISSGDWFAYANVSH